MKKLLLLTFGAALSAYGKAPTVMLTLKHVRTGGVSATVLATGLAQVVLVKRITSLPEAHIATNKVFEAYAELLQRGTEVEYAAEYFYRTNTDGMDYGFSNEYLLSLNIEEGLEYFKRSFFMSESSEALLAVHHDFRAWRDSTEQSAATLSAEAVQRLSDLEASSDMPERERLSIVLADMNWIRKTLFDSRSQRIVPTRGETQLNTDILGERMLHGAQAR